MPADEMMKSELNAKRADLCLCLGTTLQIMPVGGYPLLSKKHANGKIIIVNLQETRIDKNADLIINQKLDLVFQRLFEKHLNYACIRYELNAVDVVLKLDNDFNESKKYLLDISNIVMEEKKIVKKEEEEKQQLVEPHLVLIICGNRKSGKDFISSRIVNYLTPKSYDVRLITLSANLKEQYAKENDLDYERLLDSSDYKEKFRADMIKYVRRFFSLIFWIQIKNRSIFWIQIENGSNLFFVFVCFIL